MTTQTDSNGLIKPIRPRRMDNNVLPRGGSNHMGKLRREIISVFNATVVSNRHVDEFDALMTAVVKEVRSFKKENEQYKKDQAALAVQLAEHAEVRTEMVAEADKLAEDESPLVTVFKFTVKAELDAWAAEQGIELDGRNDLEFMQTDFVNKYNKLEEAK